MYHKTQIKRNQYYFMSSCLTKSYWHWLSYYILIGKGRKWIHAFSKVRIKTKITSTWLVDSTILNIVKGDEEMDSCLSLEVIMISERQTTPDKIWTLLADITQTSIKDHQLTLMQETHKE